MTDLPALWALDEAAKRTGRFKNWAEVLEYNSPATIVSQAIIAHARTIERHEKPPASRELLCARYHAAEANKFISESILAGERDDDPVVTTRLSAIQLYASGYGEDAE